MQIEELLSTYSVDDETWLVNCGWTGSKEDSFCQNECPLNKLKREESSSCYDLYKQELKKLKLETWSKLCNT